MYIDVVTDRVSLILRLLFHPHHQAAQRSSCGQWLWARGVTVPFPALTTDCGASVDRSPSPPPGGDVDPDTAELTDEAASFLPSLRFSLDDRVSTKKGRAEHGENATLWKGCNAA